REPILRVSQDYDTFLSFSPDSQQVALCQPDHSIQIYELPSGAPQKQLPGLPGGSTFFHPNGRQLAVLHHNMVKLCDLSDGRVLATFKHEGGPYALAWRSDGKVFATGCVDSDIYLWDVAHPAQPLRVLKGHLAGVEQLDFSHGGDLLLSDSHD